MNYVDNKDFIIIKVRSLLRLFIKHPLRKFLGTLMFTNVPLAWSWSNVIYAAMSGWTNGSIVFRWRRHQFKCRFSVDSTTPSHKKISSTNNLSPFSERFFYHSKTGILSMKPQNTTNKNVNLFCARLFCSVFSVFFSLAHRISWKLLICLTTRVLMACQHLTVNNFWRAIAAQFLWYKILETLGQGPRHWG
jgi:hypothetical protein